MFKSIHVVLVLTAWKLQDWRGHGEKLRFASVRNARRSHGEGAASVTLDTQDWRIHRKRLGLGRLGVPEEAISDGVVTVEPLGYWNARTVANIEQGSPDHTIKAVWAKQIEMLKHFGALKIMTEFQLLDIELQSLACTIDVPGVEFAVP